MHRSSKIIVRTSESGFISPLITPKIESEIISPPSEPIIPLSDLWLPRVLVIGPGGIKGLKVLGFLSPIEDQGLLKTIDTYCGVSVGAVICLLIVAGYEIRDIVGAAVTLDIFKDLENPNVKAMIENKGFMSNEPFRKKLSELILNKFGYIPTLSNLYLSTGLSFVAVTLNATDEECVMMGPSTHPHISCVDATMLSMNVPFIFYQLSYQNKIYVDGALGNPYPIDYFDDGNTNILGIYMRTIHNTHPTPERTVAKNGGIIQKLEPISTSSLSIGSYYLKIVYSLMDQHRYNIMQNASTKCKHVCLESQTNDTIGFTVKMEDKAKMLADGYYQGKLFISQLLNNEYVPPKIPPRLKYEYPPYYLQE